MAVVGSAATSVAAILLGFLYFNNKPCGPPDEIKINPSSTSVYPILKTTFPQVPGADFFHRPRTEGEAISSGWQKLSDCDDGNINFPGNRYTESTEPNDIVLIYDRNGVIAGIQAVIDASIVNNNLFDFDASPYSQRGDFLGKEAFYMTVWFVEPNGVCGGKSRGYDRLRSQGTVENLYIQAGPTPDNRLSVPMTNDGMNNDTTIGWTEVTCWPPMGKHYVVLPVDDCKTLVPYTIIYNQGKLHGVVFNVLALNPGPKYEVVTTAVMRVLFPPSLQPSCLTDITENIHPISAMHVYFDENFETSNCAGAAHPLPFTPSPPPPPPATS